MTMDGVQRVNILGVGVSAVNWAMVLNAVDTWIKQGQRHYVCVTGVHGVIESQRDENLRRIHNEAGLVTPDGMPLVWVSHANGFPFVDRIYGPDLMLALCKHSVSKGYSHYFYGGAEGVPERLAGNLADRFPGLKIVGLYSPPFAPLTPDQDNQIVEMIDGANPDIIWVGLSTPKQEFWMAKHLNRVKAPVMIGVGAAFDFHAGMKRQAPRWIQRIGFEWLFRLYTEPRRLWRRYLSIVPRFILLTTAQALGLKRYTLD
jgi:N-acetylglucosaminyldiphosphoundecaprenol N-acetyl-beta-D-mannosaminyltransferase